MDVFLLPSLYEGLPLVAIEAQSAGLPCVLSDAISKEVKLTNLLSFYPLAPTPRQWAEAILQDASKPRKNTYKEISEAGYDIIEQSNNLISLTN